MTPQQWQRVHELFEQAASFPQRERTALLERVCPDDPEVRAEAQSLLAHDDDTPPGFLRPPTPSPEPREQQDPFVGRRIGRYVIQSVLATGGMGTVYAAEQERPRRTVALKVMKGWAATRSVLRRFEFESEVLASLRHPNIAQVYEAGTHRDGDLPASTVPYFVMEYVPGALPITNYAEHRGLSIPAQLEVFTQVCDAVQHGHQKGIIHRDLKPANILVDGAGRVKVIDFGVARSTDADVAVTTMRTDVGELVGTVQYMSPEQCRADPHDLDTRTDVYSLGVVLYELLTGRLPYDLGRVSVPEATRVICTEAPPRPSAINRKLRGDLETIVLKALEKDRDRRYQSAAQFAADVHHYLSGEPIAARPPTAWTRSIRWIARHPIITSACASILVAGLVILGTYVSVWYLSVRPHRMVLEREDTYRVATLLAQNGKTLHRWAVKDKGEIGFAKLVERPPSLGGGKIVILSFGWAREYPAFSQSLCAFDPSGDLTTPLWQRSVATNEIPEHLRRNRGYVGSDFGAGSTWVLDVFPDRPGKEIVTTFGHYAYSQRPIRIYDLAGELLYQVWYDGTVPKCYWMASARLLVFAGLNAEVFWPQRGHAEVAFPHAWTVFAIRPVERFIVTEFLRSGPGESRLHAAWYRCLLPASACDVLTIRGLTAPPAAGLDPGRFVQCAFAAPESTAGFSMVLNEFGREVIGERVVNNPYRMDPTLPDPNEFYLGDLPPTVPPSSLGNDARVHDDSG